MSVFVVAPQRMEQSYLTDKWGLGVCSVCVFLFHVQCKLGENVLLCQLFGMNCFILVN